MSNDQSRNLRGPSLSEEFIVEFTAANDIKHSAG